MLGNFFHFSQRPDTLHWPPSLQACWYWISFFGGKADGMWSCLPTCT